MPTKEEILKKLKIDYSKLSCPEDYAAEVLFLNAMEEYAKQEAKIEAEAYYQWVLKSQCDWFNYATPDDLWNEYQKSKVKK